MRHSRQLVESVNDDEYSVFEKGVYWGTFTNLDYAKEFADDLYSKFGKPVKVCDGDGKVVYRPRFNVESRRPRGRMLKEDKSSPEYQWHMGQGVAYERAADILQHKTYGIEDIPSAIEIFRKYAEIQMNIANNHL